MVDNFLASEVRKVTSVPILELCSADPTGEDIEMADTGPAENSGPIADSRRHQSDDIIAAEANSLSQTQSTPAPIIEPVRMESDTDATLYTDSGLARNLGEVSDGAALAPTVTGSQSDHNSGGSRSNSPPATSSTPVPNPLNPNPDDDIEYDVEKIVGVAHNAEGTWYRCKFVGYADEEWAHENDLKYNNLMLQCSTADLSFCSSCDRLLKEFYASASVAGEDSEQETEPESETDQRKRKKRKPNPGIKPAPNPRKNPRKRKPKGTYFSELCLDNTEHLAALISSDRLASEVQRVQESRPTQGRSSKAFFAALASPKLIPNILDLCYTQSQALTTLEHVIDNKQSSQLAIASAEFTKLTSSATVLTQAPTYERVTNLLTRTLRWTSARAHIVIYRWCAGVGPNTIKGLFELHRTEGFAGFGGNRALGLVVDHIVQHVCAAMKRNPDKHVNPTPRHGPFGPIVGGDVTYIPGGLYGLLDKGGKRYNITPIKLPDPGRVHLYAACQTCLLEVFRKAVIMPALHACENMHANSNHLSRAESDDSTISRAICRGAVLDCIVEVCQDDGILASDAVDEVIKSPWLVFPISRSDRLGPALLHRTGLTLAPLKAWLQERFNADDKIHEHSKGLGDEIHAVLLEMAAGEPHPDTIERLTHAAAMKPPTGSKTSGRRTRSTTYIRPDLEVIVPTGTLPRFALAGLVIREALNLARGLEPGNVHLRRLLQGLHATQSTASPAPVAERNPDHLNPRREFNRYTALFKEHLTPTQLTSPAGLSNALSWFGTGQGLVTERFLDTLTPSGGFFKDNADGMVQQFDNIISQNQMLTRPIQFDNSRAWGRQPNPALLAQPTRKNTAPKQRTTQFTTKRKRKADEVPKEKLTLHEKFDPLYAEPVQAQWTTHLGVIAGKDPSQMDITDLPTWSATLKLIADLEIPAFKTGLTAMQLVNTLAFSHVVRLPTVMEMADWISENEDLGARTGLGFLGFRTSGRDEIRGSYICFHHTLEHFLTKDDKALLGFHPAFSEHLLCKLKRWNTMLESDKSVTLEEIAKQLESAPWKPGLNLTDASSLPLPVVVNRKDLEDALGQEDETDTEEALPQANAELQAEFVEGSSSGMGRVVIDSVSSI
ncbi:hypothetical protein MSAN_02065900 [Mycena sanguinolenta]|uniref:Chromo domain-containing protein n=1 Tax=Mycena sanguinolenta TaxID=230812 RepID=A0A8H6XJL1_9AGAR|nr:hypothetical protein MSAN_02065900 [Mycena sanguinolenta]